MTLLLPAPDIGDTVHVKDSEYYFMPAEIDEWYQLKDGTKIYVVVWYDNDGDCFFVATATEDQLEAVQEST